MAKVEGGHKHLHNSGSQTLLFLLHSSRSAIFGHLQRHSSGKNTLVVIDIEEDKTLFLKTYFRITSQNNSIIGNCWISARGALKSLGFTFLDIYYCCFIKIISCVFPTMLQNKFEPKVLNPLLQI